MSLKNRKIIAGEFTSYFLYKRGSISSVEMHYIQCLLGADEVLDRPIDLQFLRIGDALAIFDELANYRRDYIVLNIPQLAHLRQKLLHHCLKSEEKWIIMYTNLQLDDMADISIVRFLHYHHDIVDLLPLYLRHEFQARENVMYHTYAFNTDPTVSYLTKNIMDGIPSLISKRRLCSTSIATTTSPIFNRKLFSTSIATTTSA
jgi:hypothetical protein